MGKDIEKIRKSISARKRDKSYQQTGRKSKSMDNLYHVQEEEKHGYLPFPQHTPGMSGQRSESKWSYFLLRVLISACLFFAVASLIKMEASWVKSPKEWVVHNLQEDFPFAAVTDWYQGKFGSPLELVESKEDKEASPAALPVNGVVSETFQSHGKGIVMTSDEPAEVVAMDEGTVIFAGKDEQTEQTIILQHSDGSKSIYGYLSSIDVHLYEHVNPKDVIGKINPEQGETSDFFFAVEKDNKFIDPVEAIKVDEKP
ncbi:M23 family metallopeptidase [Thalassobacillus pellis]|uniref:M23 family metallopeptidase n=1 Tax=Thalassobacillus pellis TaxID=748008 RepID=UPI001960D5C8|nr:M23 family metallopeptidase [Thalassobacillus pellis]MBM7554622.1 stage IV sporulation protein FA [Thalassobacillus pellis]